MKTRQILQLIAILALFTWGGMFIYFYTSGRIENFVTPGFREFALVAGMGLCVLGAFNLLTLRQEVDCGHDHDHAHAGGSGHDHHDHEHDESCGHGHEHHNHAHDHGHDHELPASNLVIAVLILTVPLLMAANVSKDRFSTAYIIKIDNIEQHSRKKRFEDSQARLALTDGGKPDISLTPIDQPKVNPKTDSPPETEPRDPAPGSDAADSPPETADAAGEGEGDEWGAFTMEDLKRMVPQNSEGKFLLDVPQLFYTAGDEELMAVMEGIPVETIAQVMPETINNPDGTRLRIFRLFIECCAADARPLSIPIEFGKDPPSYEEMGWVKVIGKMHYNEEGDEIVPVINVETMEPTAEPVDMMMY